MNNELRERLCQHFTKGELVEFLPLSLTDLIDYLDEPIMDNLEDIIEETCFELETDADKDTE